MDEEEIFKSVIDSAFSRSDLPLNIPEGQVCSIGVGDDVDWFVHNVLAVAGIKVECVKEIKDVPKYSVMQIVGRPRRAKALENQVESDIRLADKEDMLGLQVKLHGEHTWKVEVADDALEQHRAGSARTAARSAQAKKVTKIENMHLYEIAVPVPGLGMRCTVAVPRTVTINIAFVNDEEDDLKSVWKDDLPLISQRRIDAVCVNKFVHCVQVCSMF